MQIGQTLFVKGVPGQEAHDNALYGHSIDLFKSILKLALEKLKESGETLTVQDKADVRNRVKYCFVVCDQTYGGAGRYIRGDFITAQNETLGFVGIAEYVIGVNFWAPYQKTVTSVLHPSIIDEWNKRSVVEEVDFNGSSPMLACSLLQICLPHDAPNDPYFFFAKVKPDCPPAIKKLAQILAEAKSAVDLAVRPPMPVISATVEVKVNPERQKLEAEIQTLVREEQKRLQELAALSKRIEELRVQQSKLSP